MTGGCLAGEFMHNAAFFLSPLNKKQRMSRFFRALVELPL
jgi:hypothetical protein